MYLPFIHLVTSQLWAHLLACLLTGIPHSFSTSQSAYPFSTKQPKGAFAKIPSQITHYFNHFIGSHSIWIKSKCYIVEWEFLQDLALASVSYSSYTTIPVVLSILSITKQIGFHTCPVTAKLISANGLCTCCSLFLHVLSLALAMTGLFSSLSV